MGKALLMGCGGAGRGQCWGLCSERQAVHYMQLSVYLLLCLMYRDPVMQLRWCHVWEEGVSAGPTYLSLGQEECVQGSGSSTGTQDLGALCGHATGGAVPAGRGAPAVHRADLGHCTAIRMLPSAAGLPQAVFCAVCLLRSLLCIAHVLPTQYGAGQPTLAEMGIPPPSLPPHPIPSCPTPSHLVLSHSVPLHVVPSQDPSPLSPRGVPAPVAAGSLPPGAERRWMRQSRAERQLITLPSVSCKLRAN